MTPLPLLCDAEQIAALCSVLNLLRIGHVEQASLDLSDAIDETCSESPFYSAMTGAAHCLQSFGDPLRAKDMLGKALSANRSKNNDNISGLPRSQNVRKNNVPALQFQWEDDILSCIPATMFEKGDVLGHEFMGIAEKTDKWVPENCHDDCSDPLEKVS